MSRVKKKQQLKSLNHRHLLSYLFILHTIPRDSLSKSQNFWQLGTHIEQWLSNSGFRHEFQSEVVLKARQPVFSFG